MKKKILTCGIAFVMLFSVMGGGCSEKKGQEEKNELIWTNYQETTYAYVSDMYYYSIPTVQDEQGTTYEVFVDVTEENGKEVDYFGGFFTVQEPKEYKITYSVDDGEDVYSKVTTVIGIEKAKYQLADASDVIFTVGEEINLNGMVNASVEGEVCYSVKKGEETVAVTDSTFTATQVGVYTVEATMDKQPTYSFELYVVEAAQRPYADGMILDGTSAQDIRVNTSHDDYSAAVTFDESVKYDSASNGSYKIKAKTEGKLAKTKTLGFGLQPAYNKEYYQALQSKGYQYVAIRYMVQASAVSGTASFQYANASNTNRCAMGIYYDGGKIVDNPNTYAFWWNENLTYVPVGSWAEMLLDIDLFTSLYADQEISLFRFTVNGANADKGIEGSSLDVTMYIDNVYAVKGEAITAETQVVNKGEQVDLSNMLIDKVYLNGKETSVSQNKLSVDEYGLYEVAMIDRTVYGIPKQPITAKGSVVSYETSSFSAQHKTTVSTYTKFISSSNNGEITLSSNQASTTTSVFAATYSINPIGDKAYYEALRDSGKNYITYTYTMRYDGELISPYSAGDSATKIQRNALTSSAYQHYNTVGLPDSERTVKAYAYHYTDASGNVKNTADKGSGKYFVEMVGADCKDGTAWKAYTISIAIDDFIALYNADQMNILTLGFTFRTKENVSYSVTFGKMQATTQACVFDA